MFVNGNDTVNDRRPGLQGAGRHRTAAYPGLAQQGPRTTGEICSELPKLNRCTVMQHLGVLESAELVISKKRGRSRWNYLDVSPIQRIYDRWIGEFASPSAQLLDRLKQDLETS